ncbi:hypothetical protein BC832DRAFT_226417 [Gaertneriomyces semiglobifer]|nr:hypothetical protein BC832DRAFT_226417 [Gaertneriomyces semiglobifer]
MKKNKRINNILYFMIEEQWALAATGDVHLSETTMDSIEELQGLKEAVAIEIEEEVNAEQSQVFNGAMEEESKTEKNRSESYLVNAHGAPCDWMSNLFSMVMRPLSEIAELFFLEDRDNGFQLLGHCTRTPTSTSLSIACQPWTHVHTLERNSFLKNKTSILTP